MGLGATSSALLPVDVVVEVGNGMATSVEYAWGVCESAL